MQYDPTNKAIVFVENGIFAKAGVESLQAQRKPIIKAKVNVDGKDVEIAFYFDMIWDEVTNQPTNKYKLTKTGNKMLKGKVELPFVANAVESVANEPFIGDMGRDLPDDDEF